MRSALGRTLGVAIIASIVTLASTASAQTDTRWKNAKDQSYYLSVAGGGQCGAGHGSCWYNNGTQVVIWHGYSNDQEWFATQDGTPSTIYSARFLDPSWAYNSCIGVAGSSTSWGANLVMWQCNGNADQTWTAHPASDFGLIAPGCFVFQNSDGQVMAVAGGTMSNGTHVVQWPVDQTHAATIDQAWCPE